MILAVDVDDMIGGDRGKQVASVSGHYVIGGTHIPNLQVKTRMITSGMAWWLLKLDSLLNSIMNNRRVERSGDLLWSEDIILGTVAFSQADY